MSTSNVVHALETVELTEDELTNVVGGYQAVQEGFAKASASAGYICSLSAECNTGHWPPCNPFYW